MRFKFETKRQGRCFAESEHDDDAIRVEIWYDQNTDPKKVEYLLHIRDEPLPKQITEAGALQDATRIAINHFHATKTKDGDEFEMHCSRITARWPGTLYNKLGG
jgi:hypothetical protein